MLLILFPCPSSTFIWSNILGFDLFLFFLIFTGETMETYWLLHDEGKTERENDCLIFFWIESNNIIESTNNWIGAWDWIRGIEKNTLQKSNSSNRLHLLIHRFKILIARHPVSIHSARNDELNKYYFTSVECGWRELIKQKEFKFHTSSPVFIWIFK